MLFWIHKASTSSVQVGGDIHGWAPKLSTQTVVFTDNTGAYSYDPYNATKQDRHNMRMTWKQLFPSVQGWLNVSQEEIEQYELPTIDPITKPWDVPDTPAVQLSVSHQLHCVWYLQEEYHRSLRRDKTQPVGHFHHCIEFLAQTIACAADMSLGYLGGSGHQTTHVCKNREELGDLYHDRAVVDEDNAWEMLNRVG
ncbi:DUF3328 domain-containing protein [Phlyctema vagabunda]|uniref:DUF3328 domain-containing protein n=1 Tax=Phlyctema vagabunda TaxID=108571 RepID=A0ABR4PTT6_9HELO